MYLDSEVAPKSPTFHTANRYHQLKKQKITLSLANQSEWKDFYETTRSEINQLQSEIEKTDKKIDQMVYQLYKLTDEEIAIVENSIN